MLVGFLAPGILADILYWQVGPYGDKTLINPSILPGNMPFVTLAEVLCICDPPCSVQSGPRPGGVGAESQAGVCVSF